MKIIKLGTRGSKLALVQSEMVKALIEKTCPEVKVELEIIKTKGDILINAPLDKSLDKGLFTTEIKNAIVNKSVDIAVHSLKDLPVEETGGTCLGAYIKRVNPLDVFLSKDGKALKDLSLNDVIATSSPRRRAQILAQRPGQKLISIRGNVGTRIQKMKDGYCDALIMAAAGIERLSLDHEITHYLEEDMMLPAPGQAVVAVEARKEDKDILEILAKINDITSQKEVEMERMLLQRMGGGCSMPLGTLCRFKDGEYDLKAFMTDENNSVFKKERLIFKEEDIKENLDKMFDAINITND